MASPVTKHCFLLIVVGGMERFVHKGISANLVTYLTDVIGLSNSSAARYVNTWAGFTSMLPLIVAAAADSCCRNRSSAISAFAIPYVAGLLALTSRSLRWEAAAAKKPPSISSLSWSLYMISLGQAGYNPSLQAFGAEQLSSDDGSPVSDAGKRRFFQWWYLGICCGSLLGVSIMSYVQDTFGWGLGFAIPTIFMVSSVAMFLLGNKLFMSSAGNVFHDIRRGISKILCLVSNVEEELEEKAPFTADMELGVRVSAIEEEEEDKEKRQQQQEEHMGEVVLKLFPIWVSLLMFAVIYQQPATFFTKQGMAMNRTIAGGRFKIPPAALQSAITVSIIILMPLYDRLFIPLARLLTRDENGVSVKQRISIGMTFAVASMAVAAAVEKRRLERKTETTPMTIAWLLPQYVLLGISDVFAVVGMQEFFYGEVPARMKTVGIALYTSVFGFGSLLGAMLIAAIERLTNDDEEEGSWFSSDGGRLDKYYSLLGLASFFSFLAFLIFSNKN